MQINKELIDLFLFNLPPIRDRKECWPWMGGKTGAQYGTLYYKGNQYKAHTLSYFIFKGDIPENHLIRHICDNPCCVNPNHLLTGTQSDNLLDALKGERLPNHSLHEEDVRAIKWELKYRNYHGLSKKLAALYGVNRKAIYKIGAGITWKHVQV